MSEHIAKLTLTLTDLETASMRWSEATWRIVLKTELMPYFLLEGVPHFLTRSRNGLMK
tara:strand:+ start:224 stop:397 length:174 start_codon:yes stop_codon:yes gene_type:complete